MDLSRYVFKKSIRDAIRKIAAECIQSSEGSQAHADRKRAIRMYERSLLDWLKE